MRTYYCFCTFDYVSNTGFFKCHVRRRPITMFWWSLISYNDKSFTNELTHMEEKILNYCILTEADQYKQREREREREREKKWPSVCWTSCWIPSSGSRCVYTADVPSRYVRPPAKCCAESPGHVCSSRRSQRPSGFLSGTLWGSVCTWRWGRYWGRASSQTWPVALKTARSTDHQQRDWPMTIFAD